MLGSVNVRESTVRNVGKSNVLVQHMLVMCYALLLIL
jgi:hypothetical protein